MLFVVSGIVSLVSVSFHRLTHSNKYFSAESPVILLFMNLISKSITDKKLRVYW